jgi:Tfp pilus assembly protein PilN
MRKIPMLIGGLAMMCTTLVAAAPRATTQQMTPAQNENTLPWLAPQQQACTLLCIQGYHCCIIHNQQQCVPDTQACP